MEDDKFYEELNQIIDEVNSKIKRDDYKVLAFVVDRKGYISDEMLRYIAEKLGTFDFLLEKTVEYYPKLAKARKKHYIEICIGKNCGRVEITKFIEELRSVVDYPIVERVCLGVCSTQPAVKIDGKIFRYENFDELKRKLLELE